MSENEENDARREERSEKQLIYFDCAIMTKLANLSGYYYESLSFYDFPTAHAHASRQLAILSARSPNSSLPCQSASQPACPSNAVHQPHLC
jgi:hypothetical protein